jgi:hypothetical protein
MVVYVLVSCCSWASEKERRVRRIDEMAPVTEVQVKKSVQDFGGGRGSWALRHGRTPACWVGGAGPDPLYPSTAASPLDI